MKYKLTPLIACVCLSFFAKAQTKVIGECTLQFDIFQVAGETLNKIGVKKVFIKGTQCKTVVNTPSFQQTLFTYAQEDSAIVLKEMGNSKFYQKIQYPIKAWPTLVSMKPLCKDSTFIIQGYMCKQLELSFSDGTVYEITYTTEVIPTVADFEWAFKEVPGMVLSYLIKDQNKNWVLYKVNSIDLNPITINQFDINKSQYQIIETKRQ